MGALRGEHPAVSDFQNDLPWGAVTDSQVPPVQASRLPPWGALESGSLAPVGLLFTAK